MKQQVVVGRDAPRCVDDARAAYTHAGVLFDSSLAKAAVPYQQRADATAGFPGAAFWSSCHSTGTAHATGRSDNYEYWLHRPHADCHHLLGGVPGHEAIALLDSAASHPVGTENQLQ